ncbi:MAG: LysM peptidoglycan-binding domain-containing protein [Muribaculaceae bacterium]|nr:LysM peptidoglycan-binding domain-containing protein [Muribaculaceae bacterium]
MGFTKSVIAACILCAASVQVSAQVDNLPRKNVNGASYFYYEVQPKETVYSISRKLGISSAEIQRLNPSVADGLKAGQVLYFPAEGDVLARTHIVKNKETLYGIGKLYGVSATQLLEWNPSAKDGIRPGQTLYVSAPETIASMPEPAKVAVPASGHSYTIGQGETLYSIATSHGTTVDALVAANPTLDRNHYAAGTVIVIPEGEVAAATVGVAPEAPYQPAVTPAPVTVSENVAKQELPNSTAEPNRYVVKKGETFYSIAHANGITVEELEKANPEVGILSEGRTLMLPAVAQVQPPFAEQPSAGAFAENDPDSVVAPAASIDIALALPLMLSSGNQPRQAQLYTEFYKGFLVGVDSMRNCGNPINIQVYDTSASLDSLNAILRNPALASAKVIVAPDNESQLALLGRYGMENRVNILNLFVVKDELYQTNPFMMQGNIPHKAMYSKAISGIIERMGSHIPVILTRNNGEKDKDEYMTMLKETLDGRGIEYKEIFFDGTMKTADLQVLDADGEYAFIPYSGRQVELNRVLPAILDFKSKSLRADPVKVFGYPEWTTFRGETLQNMHKANSFVYSRFFTVPEDPAVKSVEDRYAGWYGSPMANFVPRQGLFGYDTALFLINWLRSEDAPEGKPVRLEGVQNGFDFKRSAGGGWVNDELYFINYRPSGLIDKITL